MADPNPARPSGSTWPRRSAVLLAVGALLLAVGVWGTFVRRVAYGWTSYTPLTSEPSVPRMVVLDTPGLLGLAAMLVGVAILAGTFGYELSSRRRPRDSGPTPR